MQLNSKRSCVRCKQFWVCRVRIFAKDDSSTLYFTMKARKMQEGETSESGVPMITPSVIACGDATFPKGTAFSGSDKVSGSAQRLPLGGAGALAPEGVTPSRENGIAERPQALRYPEIINSISLNYAQSERGAHFKSCPLTTQNPIWKSSAAGCAAATEKASGCGAPRGAMHGWRCTGAPDMPCPACAFFG